MTLIGARVRHKSLGAGTITDEKPGYVKVRFNHNDAEIKFAYTFAFEKFLTFESAELQKAAMAAFAEMNKKRQDELRRQEEQRKKAYRQPLPVQTTKGSRTASKPAPGVKEMPYMYGDGIIGPKTSFATHADALNACFEFHYKHFQKAYKDLGNGYAVWFPNIARKADGQYMSSDTYWGWLNILSDSGDTITEMDNPEYPGFVGPDANKRIVFARFDNDKRYRFIGVYANPKRVENANRYTRVATMLDTRRMVFID